MSKKGWISLHRQLLDKPIWKKSTPEQKAILITLLLMANHEETEWEWNGEKFKVKPGQMVTSLDSIAREAGKGITVQNVRTALKKFERYEFLTNKSTKTGRLITIVNWELYQDLDKKLTEEATKNQQRPNKDLTPNNNDNNVINIEEDEEERVPSLEISDKVPSLCQEENDPVLKFLNQVSSYYTTLTGRLTSPNDEVAITDISKHTTNFEIVKEAMDNTFRNYKPRYKGDKIRGFRYFVPGILEQIAIEKERQKRREVKVANGNEFLGTETERAPKFDKSKFLYKGG